jgi:hypothetical protein
VALKRVVPLEDAAAQLARAAWRFPVLPFMPIAGVAPREAAAALRARERLGAAVPPPMTRERRVRHIAVADVAHDRGWC